MFALQSRQFRGLGEVHGEPRQRLGHDAVPLAVSPRPSGFGPQLKLSCDFGACNRPLDSAAAGAAIRSSQDRYADSALRRRQGVRYPIPLTRPRTPWCWATTAYDAGSRPPAAAPVELAGNGCSTSSTRPVHAGHARAHNRRELGSVPADPVATKPRPGRSRGSIRRHQRRPVRPGFGCVSRRSFLLDTRPESAGRRKQGGPPFVPWHRELGSSRNERVLEGGGSEHRVELRGLVNDRKHRQT